MSIRKALPLLGIAVLLGVARVDASSLDLTTDNAFGTRDGAVFIQATGLSGTGVFPSFVQITGNNPVDGAYNTTVNRVLDNGSDDPHNHEITLSELQAVLFQGASYYGFLLDIDEPNNESDRYLSLDDLVVLTSTEANQSFQGIPAGTTRFDLSADNTILLNSDLSSGNGKFDMVFLVPTANFADALSTDFVYLYSAFGAKGLVGGRDYSQNNGGFNEWAMGQSSLNVCDVVECTVTTTSAPVPEPASLILLGTGLAVVGRRFRKNRR